MKYRERRTREAGARRAAEVGTPHSVHVSPEEIDVLARRGVCVSHNPVSNMTLGDGIAPVVECRRAGAHRPVQSATERLVARLG